MRQLTYYTLHLDIQPSLPDFTQDQTPLWDHLQLPSSLPIVVLTEGEQHNRPTRPSLIFTPERIYYISDTMELPAAARPLLTTLLLLLIVACCCGYVVDSRSAADTVGNQLVAAQTAAATSGRRFGWVISWLNERGPIGQLFANVIVALFVLPPLGPFVCAFLENCDSLKIRARSFLRSLGDAVEPVPVRGSRSISDDVAEVLEKLEAAYDKYSSL